MGPRELAVFCCSNASSFVTAVHPQSLCWRKICPGFNQQVFLSFGTGWSSLYHSSLSFSISRVDYICGEQQQSQPAFFTSLLIQGLQCCLSEVVTLIIWQLPLELQSQHVLYLLWLFEGIALCFCSSSLHTLAHFTSIWWENQNNEVAEHLCPLHRIIL